MRWTPAHAALNMTTLAAMTLPATREPGDDTSSKHTLDTNTVRHSILTNTIFLDTPLGNVVFVRKSDANGT